MIANALSVLLPGRGATAQPGTLDDFWYQPAGETTSAGIDVTIDNAQRISAFYGCIRILRETLGHLPLCIYERTEKDSTEKATNHPLWNILHDRPNRWQTAFTFFDMGINHLYLRGNFYCLIIGRDDDTELWPLNPDRMEVEQNEQRDVRYVYHPVGRDKITYRAEEIYHVMGGTLNGIKGISVIEYARNAIGSAIAQETHGASLFKNGGLPTFWIFRPPERKWTEQAQRNFRKGWRRMHGGSENSGNPPILSDGMELRELSLNNRDSQWIESRGLSAEEICRFFGISPHMIGIKSTAPKSSTEQQALEFQMYTLTPLAARFEQAANRSLLNDEEKYFTKFNLDAQRRADTKSRHEAHNIAVQGGWKTVNEVRALEDLNPIEGGDECRFPMNMQPAGGGPDENEQGGQPGKGQPKPPEQNGRPGEAAQASFTVLLEEVAERIAAAEIKALSVRAGKAADDRSKWCEWAKGVYRKHHIYSVKTLAPLCRAWALTNKITPDPECLADELCDSSESWEIFDTKTDVPALLEKWRITAAGKLSEYLKQEFFYENL